MSSRRAVAAQRARQCAVAALVLAVTAAASSTLGCGVVHVWERGRLAHDCMQIPVDAVEVSWYAHVYSVREGAAGGAMAGGGGCGCN